MYKGVTSIFSLTPPVCTCHLFFYVALLAQAKKQQPALLSGFRLDANLLGLLNGNGLLTQADYGEINARIERNNDQAAGTYFVNTVMFQWSPEVFESNMHPLIEALESHESPGSQSVAKKLRKLLEGC